MSTVHRKTTEETYGKGTERGTGHATQKICHPPWATANVELLALYHRACSQGVKSSSIATVDINMALSYPHRKIFGTRKLGFHWCIFNSNLYETLDASGCSARQMQSLDWVTATEKRRSSSSSIWIQLKPRPPCSSSEDKSYRSTYLLMNRRQKKVQQPQAWSCLCASRLECSYSQKRGRRKKMSWSS